MTANANNAVRAACDNARARARRLGSRPLAALALLWCASAGAATYTADFEAGAGGAPEGWRFVQQRGKCAGKWDTLDGSRCIRLSVADDPTARATWHCEQRVAVKPNTPYRLRVRVLVAEVGRAGRAYVIAYENGVEAPSHWHTTPYLRGTQDWTEYSVQFSTRPDAEWLKLQCKLWYSTGYAWFDDLTIEELPPDTDVSTPPGQLPPPKDDGAPLQLMWYPAQRRPDATLWLLEGAFNPVAFFPFGDRAAAAEPHIILETPAQMRVAGEVVAGRSPMPPVVHVRPERVTRDGKPRLRWRLPAPVDPLRRNMGGRKPLWTGYHFVYVEPLPGCPREFEWRWRTECAGKLGPEHTIAAKLARKKGGALEPVKDFALYAQHTGALRYPTPAGRGRLLDYLAYAGIRGGLSLTHYQPEYATIDAELAARGFRLWAWKFDGYGSRVKGWPCIGQDGKPMKGKLCPSAQVRREDAWWSALVEYYRKRLASGLKTLIIDYEPPVFNACFCPTCRRNFAQAAKLDEAKVAAMTPAEIQRLPGHAWGRFRAEQNGAIVKHHIAAIHLAAPGVSVGLCSWPLSEWEVNRGGDIRKFEPEVGFHAPMIYSVGTPYEGLVQATCEGTTAPVLPFLLASDMAVPHVFPMPDDVRLNLLATALSGGRGAILWVGIESLDGEYMNALRRSLDEIRILQRFIVGGTRAGDVQAAPYSPQSRAIEVDGREIVIPKSNSAPAVRTWAWRSQAGTLVAAINYDQAHRHMVRIAGAARARGLLGPAPKRVGNDAVITLRPRAMAAIAWLAE